MRVVDKDEDGNFGPIWSLSIRLSFIGIPKPQASNRSTKTASGEPGWSLPDPKSRIRSGTSKGAFLKRKRISQADAILG